VDRAQVQFLPFKHDLAGWLVSLLFLTSDMSSFFGNKLQLFYLQEGKFVRLLLIACNFICSFFARFWKVRLVILSSPISRCHFQKILNDCYLISQAIFYWFGVSNCRKGLRLRVSLWLACIDKKEFVGQGQIKN
jgi:hypothetical protein